MLRSGPTPQIYIFQAMDRKAGYRYLINAVGKYNNLEKIKSDETVYWLLRESNTQKGLLTIDFLYWNNQNMRWTTGSQRMALHKDKGWIKANNLEDPEVKEALKEIEHVSAESAGLHEDSLYEFISKLSTVKLLIENRLNPNNEQQAVSGIYSKYVDTRNPTPEEVKSVVLMPGVIQALTCELTGKIFRTPAVMNHDIRINQKDGKLFMILQKGKSYEESALKSIGLKEENYYINFNLMKIIDRLGCNDQGLIERLDEERLLDPVLLTTLEDPMILPSTHSYSRETIEGMINSGRTLKCPNTNKRFDKTDVVPNISLDRFLKAWPECRVKLMESFEGTNQKRRM
ncbi:U-box domain-containing protein [Candidatus Berkiella aquae]|uniref:U-box domain protein n=1 Tax=Candidatus Berkiella aquae TaxID=295108 RepID=A0A0Q9YQ63_9GAMM|nr:U-box domain-containing protein [Candidatus Berkiella aquae]MCS5709933.1 hypothetical protein [Candidatus Berkiella aquae]